MKCSICGSSEIYAMEFDGIMFSAKEREDKPLDIKVDYDIIDYFYCRECYEKRSDSYD